jgi:hypothetical protein
MLPGSPQAPPDALGRVPTYARTVPADPPRKQRVLNELVPSRDVRPRRDSIPVTVRIEFQHDGTQMLDGDAIAWTSHAVHVQLDDPRLDLSRIWLKTEDVHRRL